MRRLFNKRMLYRRLLNKDPLIPLSISQWLLFFSPQRLLSFFINTSSSSFPFTTTIYLNSSIPSSTNLNSKCFLTSMLMLQGVVLKDMIYKTFRLQLTEHEYNVQRGPANRELNKIYETYQSMRCEPLSLSEESSWSTA